MAKIEAQVAVKAAPAKASNGAAPRGKKGDGPIVITYLNDKGEVSKRVSDTTVGVRVADRHDHVVDYKIDQLSPAIRQQLVALALAKRIDTYVRNSVDDAASNVIELSGTVYDGIKNGEIYTRKEGAAGGGAGRPFDFTFWRNIMAETARLKKVNATDKLLDAFEGKLKSMTPGDRKTYLANKKNDKVFMMAWKRAEISKLSESVKKGDAGEVDALDF